MKLESGNFCPLIKANCKGLQCAWFTQLRGKDPQTDKDVDEWFCAINTLPMLLVENSLQQRQTGAAVEDLRNIVAGSTPVPESGIPLQSNREGRSPELLGRPSSLPERTHVLSSP